MAFLLDTNVVIHLRDKERATADKIAGLDGAMMISIISRVELENGVYREPRLTAIRRPRLDAILSFLPVLPFGDEAADTYRGIVEAAGYSRRKMLDRMIAAQALVHRATLVTLNGVDFRDVPRLDLLEW